MRSTSIPSDRVAVIGCGHVGATIAYALVAQGTAREIVLLDTVRGLAEGEAMDLQHAVPLHHPVRVWAGDYQEAAAASIAVVAAGTATLPGQTRLELLGENEAIVRECVRQLVAHGFAGVLLIATNPVDVLAQLAYEESGWPATRVIGSGTLLDTARLQAMLGQELGVEARSIDAFVIGEHGQSEVAAWSAARIGGMPLGGFSAERSNLDWEELLRRVRRAAPEIVERKGYTSFAIASCVARICEAILNDEHSVLPVSTLVDGQYGITGVYLSLPCVIGRRGVERVITLPLNSAEKTGLLDSARVLEQAAANRLPNNRNGSIEKTVQHAI